MRVMGLARWMAGFSVGASALAGCSLIYSPSNLPGAPSDAADAPAPPDAPFDPDSLVLKAVAPGEMFEGQGVDGSRQVVLAISGANIAPDARLSLVPEDPTVAMPKIEIDNDHAVRSQFGGLLAVPITLPVDVTADGDVALAIQVTQTGSSGQVVAPPLKGRLVLHALPELTAPPAAGAALKKQYSRVSFGDWTIPAKGAATATSIFSWSSITLGNVSANAAGVTPGPGGAGGGGPGQTGAGFGGGFPGNVLSGLLAGGGGAGFATAGGKSPGGINGGAATGDPFITSFGTNFASGGGGGGGLGNAKGGGGGGTLFLTAKGTLQVGTLSALGGPGESGTLLAAGGGGGAGGVVVVRSWVSAVLGAISVTAGSGGKPVGGIGAGGDGSPGRVRVDLPTVAPAASGAMRRGAMFSTEIPTLTRNPKEPIELISQAAATDAWQIIVTDGANATTATETIKFATPTAVYTPALTAGYNKICVLPPAGALTLDESTNCLELVYVP